MAKVIKGTSIIEDDALDNHIAQLQEILKLNKQIDAQIVKNAKTIKATSAKVGSGKEAKGIRDLTKALSESELAKRAALKIDKEKQKLDIQLKAANSDKIQQNEEIKRQLRDQNKTNKELSESTRKLVGTEEKLLAANKRLLKERKKLDTTTKVGSRRLKALNAELDRNNKVLEKNSDRLGKQRIGIGRYSKAIGGLRSGLAQLGLGLGVFALIKDSFNVIKDFDQAQANLSSVLGVTRESMSALTEQAKELGATTEFTASQVSELQLEYAKLGFTQKEIDNVTESTLQLASAAGTELANAATITGSTLRAFGLDSSETQRVVDVMAKSFSSSSLDIEKFKVAMAAVAPVAKAMGFSIEETTALIGTLTDQGIDASTAGTGLRNMFLDSKKAGLTFQEALDKIKNSTDKVGTAFDLFGKRGATLGVILAENQEVTAGLTETLNGAAGAAKEMADKQLDTLEGSIKLLRSAWEGLILKFSEGTGTTDILKNAIKFLAENLVVIVDLAFSAIKTFIIYKTALKAATLASKAFGKSFSPKGLNIYIIALTAIVFVVMELIDAFKEAEDASNLFSRIQDEVTDRLNEEKLALEQVKEQLLLTTAGSKERQKILDETNAKYGLTLENLNDEASFVEQVTVAYLDLIEALEQRLEAQVREEFLKDLIEQRFNIGLLIKELEGTTGAFGTSLLGRDKLMEKALTDLQDINDQIRDLKGEIKEGGGLAIDVEVGEEDDPEGTTTKLKKKLKTEEQLRNQEFADIVKNNQENLKILEINAIKAGKDQEEIDDILRERRLVNAQIERDATLRIFGKFSEEFLEADLKLNKALNVQTEERNEEDLKLNEKLFKDILSINEENLKILELQLLDQDKSREEIDEALADKRLEQLRDEMDEALRLFGEGSQELLDARLALKKEEQKIEDQAEKERLKKFKKFRDESLKIVKEITDDIVQNIDKRIDERQREIDESKNEVERLKDLASQGNVEAAKSIKAEQVAQAKEKLEIERLQKKKKDLLISVAFLTESIRLIEAGDGNAFANASSKLNNFLESLPKASEGTDYNVAQTFGKANKSGQDGHLTWVDGKEKIMSIENSNKLAGMHQDEVTRRALSFDNNAVSAKAISASEYRAMTDTNIVRELKANTEAIKEMEFPTSTYNPDTGEEIVRKGNKTIIYNHKPPTFRI